MPGTFIQDANAVNLLTDVDLDGAATPTAGAAVLVNKPGPCRFVLTTPNEVTGTTPTLVVLLQGCDSSDFSTTDVYSYGQLTLLTGDANSQENVELELSTSVPTKYVRAAPTLGGTSPVYTGTTLYVQPVHYHQTTADSSAIAL